MRSIFNFQFSIFNLRRGFTLIELLIVVAIISVLASLLMANFVGVRQRARDAQRKSDLRQIQSALEIYRADQAGYPTASSLVNCPVVSSTYFGNASVCNTTYMQKVPDDPLGGAYTYSPSSDGATYSIISCLENANDSQKDATNVAPCDGTSRFSYTLKNP